METIIVDPGLYPRWDKIIRENFDPDIFHSSEWAQVLKETYNFRPVYFVASENRQPVALIPLSEVVSLVTGKRGVSLPFSDYCNFLSNSDEYLKSMMEQIKAYGQQQNWKYVEFRSLCYVEEARPSEIFFTHDLDLTRSSSELWSGLKDSCRRNIKKATREGVKIEIGKSWRDLEQFYRLQVMTRKRHGLPPQPLKFFKSLYENIISNDLGIIASAHYHQKIIASSVYFNFNHKALFKYGASDEHFHQLRPNNLIMWEAINWHRQHDCQLLNLGRTESNNPGLLNYKRQWGPKEFGLKYHRFDLKSSSYISNNKKHLVTLWPARLTRLLPDSLFKFMGKLLYKHMG